MTPEDETLQPDELLAQLGWVRALARRLVSDPEVTDDVLQQVCLLALQQAPREARTGPRLRAWLATVTRNLARHSARADIRRRRHEQAPGPAAASPATDDVVAHREALRQLVVALTSLEEPYYSVVVARYLDGRPVSEIAALCEISQAAVRQRLSRARQQLRSRLQELLAGDRSRWLSAALPLAAAPASLKAASASPALSPFGGLLVAKTVPALVTAIAAGIVITGAVLFLRSDEHSGASDTAANQHMPTTPSPTERRPELPEAQPARVAALPPQTGGASTDPSGSKPAADRLALPRVPESKAWDGLFKAADDLASGAITQAGVVDLAFDVLAQLPPDATPVVANGVATYDLLDKPGYGKVHLVMNLESPAEAARRDPARTTFTINAELETRPGAYTGNAADNAKSTNVTISVNSDGHDALQNVSALSQNMVPGSPELWSQLNGGGSAIVIGGVFSIDGESATWRPITFTASGSADQLRFVQAIGEPVGRDGKLAEPRTQLLNEVLTSQCKRVPR